MPGTGSSVIGLAIQQGESLADNIERTAENLRAMDPGLREILDHFQAAMRDSHQNDVPEMEDVVDEAAQELNVAGDTLDEVAQEIRRLVENL